MKAYLIDAENHTIENIDVKSMDDIIRLVGYETIESDAVGTQETACSLMKSVF